MIKKILVRLLRDPFRKFIGVELIISKQNELKRDLITQRHEIDRVFSKIEAMIIDKNQMSMSRKNIQFQQLIPILSPMDISGAKYKRFGRDHDGGYIMLDNFQAQPIEAAYSFGISDDVSWDLEIANLGIEVFMYDHTIKKLPKSNPRFHFFQEGVSGDPQQSNLDTLTNYIVRNGHQNSNNLILKMDIEGHEWSVLTQTSSAVIGQFQQIVIELHGLDPNKSKNDWSNIIRILEKINLTHQSIHVHANGSCPISWFGDLALPHFLEVTYVRRSDYTDKFIQNSRLFPTEIDQPTFPWVPDVYLGTFTTETKES